MSHIHMCYELGDVLILVIGLLALCIKIMGMKVWINQGMDAEIGESISNSYHSQNILQIHGFIKNTNNCFKLSA